MKKILLIMFIGILLIGIVGSAVWQPTLTNDLVSYFPLNESTGVGVDWVSGNDMVHYLGNMSIEDGILGNATFYNGSASVYSNITNISAYAGTSFSVSTWLYTTGISPSVSEFIITSDGGANEFFQLQHPLKAREIETRWKVNGSDCGGLQLTGNKQNITNATWVHITGVWNGSTSLLYYNGILNNTKDCVGERTEFNGTWVIGGKFPDWSQNYGGGIDELGIWNRSLTADEITDLYNEGVGLEFMAGPYEIISNTYNATTIETLNESYTVNVTTNGTVITTYLWYNGTRYDTIQLGTSPNMEFYANVQTPLNVPNKQLTKSFIWEFEGLANSTSYSQTVDVMNLSLCMAGNELPYMNFTFKDEVSDTNIDGRIVSSTWYYWLSNANLNRTLSYSTATPSDSFGFCFNSTDRTLHNDLTMTYSNTSYPQRSFSFNTDLTNLTTNQTLYLLATADGIYVTFQVANIAEQVLSGTSVNATTTTAGVVGSGFTDDAGSITFWLNPNIEHKFVFDKDGYDLFETTITPTQSSYTVYLGGQSSNTTAYNYLRGITIAIEPIGHQLYNNTQYNFNFTTTTNFWEITEFGFTITNSSGTILGTTSEATNGGVAKLDLDTSSHRNLAMNYYYITNSTYSNGTYYWVVLSDAGTDWSIANFFTDLKSFITVGLFGLDDFGLVLIVFLIIFVASGVMAYKFGLTSPAAIMGVIFALVLFFNVGVDIIPSTVLKSPFKYFPTIIIGIIFLGTLIKEGTR